MIGFIAYWAIVVAIAAMFACGIAAFIIGMAVPTRAIAKIEARLAPRKCAKRVELVGPMAQLAERFPKLGRLLEAQMQPKPVKKLTAEERKKLTADKEDLEVFLPRVERWNAIASKAFDIAVVAATVVAILAIIAACAGLL